MKAIYRDIVLSSYLSFGIFAVTTEPAHAHTLFDAGTITEGKAYNQNLVIGHGCDNRAVIGISVVVPDGSDSIITFADGTPAGAVEDHIFWNGSNVKQWQNRAVFTDQAQKHEPTLGGIVGFWAGGGPGMAPDFNAQAPVKIVGTPFNSDSCTTRAKIHVAAADICEITRIENFSNASVGLWVPAVGSKYDGPGLHGFDSPPTFIIQRDLENNPLPETCQNPEGGVEVHLKPSAAQIDRDMPIISSGVQVWPLP